MCLAFETKDLASFHKKFSKLKYPRRLEQYVGWQENNALTQTKDILDEVYVVCYINSCLEITNSVENILNKNMF